MKYGPDPEHTIGYVTSPCYNKFKFAKYDKIFYNKYREFMKSKYAPNEIVEFTNPIKLIRLCVIHHHHSPTGKSHSNGTKYTRLYSKHVSLSCADLAHLQRPNAYYVLKLLFGIFSNVQYLKVKDYCLPTIDLPYIGRLLYLYIAGADINNIDNLPISILDVYIYKCKSLITFDYLPPFINRLYITNGHIAKYCISGHIKLLDNLPYKLVPIELGWKK